MKMLDLFSGIGGFSLAARNVYGKIEGGFSEIDKYAVSIYQKHFSDHKNYGTITAINGRLLPRYDIITFGFPCQDLSIAGRRTGFRGHRSSLFFEAIRIIDESRPAYFIAENVKGFFSSHGGKDFYIAIKTITDIGYDCQWQLLNTKWFLPQNRERVFIVGHLRGTPRPKIFPIGEVSKPYDECAENEEGQENIAWALRSRDYKDATNCVQVATIGEDSEATRVYDTSGLARTIKNGGGMGAKTGLYMVEDFYPDRVRYYDNESPTLRGDRSGLKVKEQQKIRRLTPTECERLQGFPDGWSEYGSDGKRISDTQRYKVLGNAISVPVVEEIFRRLM